MPQSDKDRVTELERENDRLRADLTVKEYEIDRLRQTKVLHNPTDRRCQFWQANFMELDHAICYPCVTQGQVWKG